MTLVAASALLAFALGLVLTPLAQRVARRTGALDRPGAHRGHKEPTPLLGGAAIFVAVMGALAACADGAVLRTLWSVLVGGSVVFLLGLLDDIRGHGLPAATKLVAQFAAAGALIAGGVHTEVLGVSIVDMVITVLWIVGITNGFNLLDNMDGLSAGTAAIAALAFAAWGASTDQWALAGLAAAVLGATLAFLFYNFSPARIFMGDAGSLFLGVTLAALGRELKFSTRAYGVHLLIPILILGLPIFDTALVTVSRIRRRVPIYVGARDHASHRLVGSGLRVRETVLHLYAAAAVLGGVAHFVARSSWRPALTAALLTLGVAAFAFWRLERRYRV